MNSLKCKNCGLTNFSTDVECRRCGYSFAPSSAQKRRDRKPRRFSVWSLLMITLFAGLLYYFYSGVQKSIDEVNANDAKRVASHPAAQPAAGLSRTEYDRQKTMTYGEAVKNSSSLAAHQQHINDTEKITQQISNAQSNK